MIDCRCHQTDKPFKCNSCYKCFTDENSLLDHIPKHKESKHLKTHICEYCGKSYTQETYLAKHMAKHADRMAGEGKRRPVGNSGHGQPSSGPPNTIPDPYNWKHATNDHMTSSSDQSDPNCAIALTSNESARYGMPSMNGHPRGGGGSMSEDMLYSVEGQKNNNPSASSAFTPIQSIPGLSSTGNSPSTGHRAYFPYGDSFNFTSPGKTSIPMDMKMDGGKMSGGNGNIGSGGGGPPPSAFPNQLIALHQIRNYASMPGGGNAGGNSSPDPGQQSNNNNKEK